MKSRRSIIVMSVAGLIATLMLSLVPGALTSLQRGQSSAAPPSAADAALQMTTDVGATSKRSREPLFDVADWYAARGEAPETHGVLIETLSGDRVFASHNADLEFNPASLIKLSTSLVALHKLGAQYRFQTRIYADGPIDDKGVLRGKLYLTGNDPSFGDINAQMLANELRARRIKRVTEGLFVSPDFTYNFSESAKDSAARLGKFLRLGKTPTDVADTPAGQVMFAVESYPLRDILLYMNAHSSNFLAEHIGALVGGPEGVRQFLVNELKLPAEQVTIERTSGRGHNRMTPRELLAVIRALVAVIHRQGMQPTDIMAVASDDVGTLRRRLAGTGLEGAVVGKTGTLTAEVDGGMASLAGIVYTQDAGDLIFAILDQGNKIADSRQMEDQLLSEVITKRASPRVVAGDKPRQFLPSSDLRVEQVDAGE